MHRSLGHLTPPYLVARTNEWAFRRRNPGAPWLTRQAIDLIERSLRPTSRGLEWGAGRSTSWFACRAASLVSVETDPAWFERVRNDLLAAHLDNVSLKLVQVDEPATDEEFLGATYVRVVDEFGDAELDWVLVDGVLRDACAVAAIPKVRPGGLLVVDNVNWVLPSSSPAPNSVPATGAPASRLWAEFRERVGGWECAWTTNRVFDTAIWIRP